MGDGGVISDVWVAAAVMGSLDGNARRRGQRANMTMGRLVLGRGLL